MTRITLDVRPQVLSELNRLAAGEGLDVPDFIRRLIEDRLESGDSPTGDVATYVNWCRDFRAWTECHSSSNPQFDDSRDSIYD